MDNFTAMIQFSCDLVNIRQEKLLHSDKKVFSFDKKVISFFTVQGRTW